MADKSNCRVATEVDISKLRELIRSRLLTLEEAVAIALELVQSLIRGDQLQTGNPQEEHKTFQVLSRGKNPDEVPLNPFAEFVFARWVKESTNTYAVAYRLGSAHKAQKITTENVKRATNGRRLIGAVSRDKVRKSAQSFRHLSKELAAPKIADAVNLSSGTVRRYLSELFPGGEWEEL